jgi:hypothetical protein
MAWYGSWLYRRALLCTTFFYLDSVYICRCAWLSGQLQIRSGIKNVRPKRRWQNEKSFYVFLTPCHAAPYSWGRAEHAMSLSSIVCTISLAIGAPKSGQTESLSRGEGASHLLFTVCRNECIFLVKHSKGMPLEIETGLIYGVCCFSSFFNLKRMAWGA